MGYPNKMSDVEPMSMWHGDVKDERRDKKKKNARKMVVDSAGLKTLTIVVKAKKKKRK